jgi:bifunctional DNA-binding transcriptional regulator/antitoxin component of YhaV-PrlF toxin-antitoxin module
VDSEVRKRKRGFTRLSRKLQLNVPKAAVEAAGLDVGDELKVEAVGKGKLVITRSDDPLEAIERFAQENRGLYPSGYLEELRAEWD